MSSSVAVFDDGLAHHPHHHHHQDWSRPQQQPRNGDSRAFYPDQAVVPPAQFDAAAAAAQSWSQMPTPAANQLTNFEAPTSPPFSTYHPSQIVHNTSAPDYHQQQSRQQQVAMHQYQQGPYTSHGRQQHVTPTPYIPPSDHQAQSSPIDSTSTTTHQQYRYTYNTPRPSYSNDDYSTSSGNVIYGSSSSNIQPPAPPIAVIAGSTTVTPGAATTTTTYEQPHNGSSGGSGGDPEYSYVQSNANANSLGYSEPEPVAPQPQRPQADYTQVRNFTRANPTIILLFPVRGGILSHQNILPKQIFLSFSSPLARSILRTNSRRPTNGSGLGRRPGETTIQCRHVNSPCVDCGHRLANPGSQHSRLTFE